MLDITYKYLIWCKNSKIRRYLKNKIIAKDMRRDVVYFKNSRKNRKRLNEISDEIKTYESLFTTGYTYENPRSSRI